MALIAKSSDSLYNGGFEPSARSARNSLIETFNKSELSNQRSTTEHFFKQRRTKKADSELSSKK